MLLVTKNLKCFQRRSYATLTKPLSHPMEKEYDPKKVEEGWYKYWINQGLFNANPENVLNKVKKPFTILMPPPNVTGSLHTGHALFISIQDALIRFKRMKGYETLWIPGIDHAGIGTQAVVESALMKKNLTKDILGREKFLESIWEWQRLYGNKILNQFKVMGCAVDWERCFFTMDEARTKAVTEAFCRMTDEGMIYRMNRIVNWCPILKTALSDIEVEQIEIKEPTTLKIPGYSEGVELGYLIQFAYKLKDNPNKEIIVSTTRLETMLGDVAVAVHPNDTRYKDFIGKELIHPFIKDRRVKVIADDSLVKMEFGTGAVKVTPAHNINDFACGEKHRLEQINVFNDDGTINKFGGRFEGENRFKARKSVYRELEKLGLIRGKVKNEMMISICQRSGDIIEPMIKPQWWMRLNDAASKSIQAVKSGQLEVIPESAKKDWYRWLENIQDWCISRQLWWGHRIPAYLCSVKGIVDNPDTNNQDHWIIATSQQQAIKKAKEKYKMPEDYITLKQDNDVLDTWFSSAILPLSALGWPNVDNKDFKAFFPSQLLETGSDILFFWVARMIMLGVSLHGSLPFGKVYLHNLVKDAQGKKMSKSKGNVIDPLEIVEGSALEPLIQRIKDSSLPQKEIDRCVNLRKKEFPKGIPQCGTDALRFTLLSYINQGTNINLDINRVIGYRHFCNKLWNAIKFTLAYLPSDFQPTNIHTLSLSFIDKWILSSLEETKRNVNKLFEELNFGIAANTLHDFWLHKLCDIYFEGIRPTLQSKSNPLLMGAHNTLYRCVNSGLRLLHPMMPFITEELYQRLPSQSHPKSILLSEYPEFEERYFDPKCLNQMEVIMNVVQSVRSVISALNIQGRPNIEVVSKDMNEYGLLKENCSLISALGRVGDVKCRDKHLLDGCIMDLVNSNLSVYLQVKGVIDLNNEIQRLNKKVSQLEDMLKKLEKKTKVKDYRTKVPEDIKAKNKEKQQSITNEIQILSKYIKEITELS